MEKINDLTNIPTNIFKEENYLIYAYAKIVCDNVVFSPENKNKMSKPGWENVFETHKKSTTSQYDKTEEKYQMLGQRKKSSTTIKKDSMTSCHSKWLCFIDSSTRRLYT